MEHHGLGQLHLADHLRCGESQQQLGVPCSLAARRGCHWLGPRLPAPPFAAACPLPGAFTPVLHTILRDASVFTLQIAGLIFSWVKLLKYARAFATFGPIVVIIGRMVKDVVAFCLLYMELLVPFSISFFLLVSNAGLPGYDTVPHALYSLFWMAFGADPSDVRAVEPDMGALLAALWIFIAGVCLVNLFIAMLSKRFTDVSDHAKEVGLPLLLRSIWPCAESEEPPREFTLFRPL